ncbi:restriction endonuclease subunit S [Veillonella parvula]|uniref:Restriction endonuclease subunit S n=1 Tax=Veillonella parvula TaxID=29466 RepID=A0AB38YNY2_VEIPA|nr:restriction endonuclease subunit S [Veillonella parvula]EFB86545.1 type I restriction modification DNA specificity domain protein [Veillonella parvula ATCC 17745]WMS19794.1 restriction endonuclease subunit S [Veillonella parvula]
MREMKDSGVRWLGMIPKSWDLDKIVSLYSERSTKVSDKDYPALSVTKQGIVPQLESAAKTDNGDNRKLIKKNDFVINSRSDRRGSCGISEYEGSCSLINIVLAPKNNMVNRYYNYLFKTELFADEFYKWGNGIVDDLWSTKWSNMKNIMVPFPSLEEQQAIAEHLDTKCAQIDTIIAKEQSVIEKLQEYKRAIITYAVVKGLDITAETADSGIEWIDSIPSHWKIKRLIFSAYIRARLGWKGLKADEYTSEGHPFLSAVNIQNDKLVWEDLNFINDDRYDESPEIKLEIGDLLLVKDGAGIGKCAVVDQLPYGTATTNSSLGVITPYPELNSMYLYYFFESAIFQNYISRIKNGMGVPHLTQGNLKNIMVIIPPYCEQEAIVTYLDEKCANLDSVILRKQSRIDKLTEYKKSLIYEVVTGKKEVSYV